MNQEEEISKQTTISEEAPKTSLAEKLRKQKLANKKKKKKRIIILCSALVFSYLVYFLFKPFQASEEYGICRTILELLIPYPETLYVSEVKNQRDGSVKLWYTHTDAFGEYRMEDFRCKIVQHEGAPPESAYREITRITMRKDKIEMSQEMLDNLNNILPYFAANPLVMTYPAALPDSLGALHFDFDAFRKYRIDNTKKY